MKMQTPEGSELIEVVDVQLHESGVIVSGQIMGAMPMRAILKPSQLRSGLKFLRPRVLLRLISMLFRPD